MNYKSERLEFSHRGIIHDRLKQCGVNISEYSFANLYLFREAHRYEVIFDREIFVSGYTYDGRRYLMPTADLRLLDAAYLKELAGEFGMFFPVPEEWLTAFDPSVYEFSYLDGDTDYIFLIDVMKTYAGKKLHNKRNLLYQFEELYTHEALPLTADRMTHAFEVLEGWQRDSGLSPGETDYRACREALERYDELVLCGAIYYADGAPAGFIVGEELGSEVFALHFAKGLVRFKGIYQFMYNNFARIMPDKYCCFNFEQDLGMESLRRAKSSYHPSCMLKKYRVTLR